MKLFESDSQGYCKWSFMKALLELFLHFQALLVVCVSDCAIPAWLLKKNKIDLGENQICKRLNLLHCSFVQEEKTENGEFTVNGIEQHLLLYYIFCLPFQIK